MGRKESRIRVNKPDEFDGTQEEFFRIEEFRVVPRHVLVDVSLRQIAVALNIRDFQFEILFELNQASELGAQVSIDLVTQMFRAVFQSLAQPPINLVHLFRDRGAVCLQTQRVFLHQGERVLQPVQPPPNLQDYHFFLIQPALLNNIPSLSSSKTIRSFILDFQKNSALYLFREI